MIIQAQKLKGDIQCLFKRIISIIIGISLCHSVMCADDTIVPPESSQAFVNALKAAGGDAEITTIDGADHFAVPALTYLNKDFHIIDWLIGKSELLFYADIVYS